MPGPGGDGGRLNGFERDGLVFDVRDGGPLDGDVVVLLHGFPQDSTAWSAVEPQLHARGPAHPRAGPARLLPRCAARRERGVRAAPVVRGRRRAARRRRRPAGAPGGARLGRRGAVGRHGALPGPVPVGCAGLHPAPRRDRVRVHAQPAGAPQLVHGVSSRYRCWRRWPSPPPWSAGCGRAACRRNGRATTPNGCVSRERSAPRSAGTGPSGPGSPATWCARPCRQRCARRRGGLPRTARRGRDWGGPTTYVWGRHDPALGRAAAERTGAFVARRLPLRGGRRRALAAGDQPGRGRRGDPGTHSLTAP